MKLHELSPAEGSKKSVKRIGRGTASGQGKTSGKGQKGHDYLQKACDLMMKYKSPDTICGTVSNIARDGEEAHVMTLKELRDTQVDMFTTVFIGNSQTKEINNKMVTPRGYRNV